MTLRVESKWFCHDRHAPLLAYPNPMSKLRFPRLLQLTECYDRRGIDPEFLGYWAIERMLCPSERSLCRFPNSLKASGNHPGTLQYGRA
jgi:hypothetical protein